MFLRRIRKNSVEYNRKKGIARRFKREYMSSIYIERTRKKIDVLEHTREMIHATTLVGRTK